MSVYVCMSKQILTSAYWAITLVMTMPLVITQHLSTTAYVTLDIWEMESHVKVNLAAHCTTVKLV